MSDFVKFNECWAKIEKSDRSAQLKQIYEWVKTSHISHSVFRSLLVKIMS